MAAYTGISDCPPPEFNKRKYFDAVRNDGHTKFWFDYQDLVNSVQLQGAGSTSLTSLMDKQNLATSGANIIPDPGFANPLAWTIAGANFNIAGGLLNGAGCTQADTCTPNAVVTAAKSWYKCEVDVVRNAGTLHITSTTVSGTDFYINATGHYIFYLFWNTAGNIRIEGDNAAPFTGTVDNLTVTLTVGQHIKQPVTADKPVLTANGILFDGVNDFLQSVGYTWNAPITVYAALRQITWGPHYLFDGFANACGVVQHGVSPQISAICTVYAPNDGGLALNTFGIVTLGVDVVPTNDWFQVNNNTPFRGSIGTNNPGGFTLAAFKSGANNGNIEVKEVFGRDILDPGGFQRLFYNYLNIHNALGLPPK